MTGLAVFRRCARTSRLVTTLFAVGSIAAPNRLPGLVLVKLPSLTPRIVARTLRVSRPVASIASSAWMTFVLIGAAAAQTDPVESTPSRSNSDPAVAEGLYRLRVVDGAPFRDELPSEVWLTHVASRERRSIQRDTPSWLLDPPLVGDDPTSRRVEWCVDADGRLLLDWTGHIGGDGIRVALTPADDGLWSGAAWKHYDVGIPGHEVTRWPAQLEPIELGPRDAEMLLASRFGELDRVLPAEGAIGGRLVRRCTGAEIEESVQVAVVDGDGLELARTRSRNGFFLLENVTPCTAPHQLVVHWKARGILPTRDRWRAGHEARAVVELGDLPPWPPAFAVEVDTGWRLVVEVVDADGVPVRAEVRAEGANGHARAVRITSPVDRTVHEWADLPWDAEPMVVHVSVDGRTVHTETVAPPERSEPTRRLRVVALVASASAQTDPPDPVPPVAEGIYRLTVSEAAPFVAELPSEVWLTHVASRASRPLLRDTTAWLLDPPLLGEYSTERRVEWCVDASGTLRLDWSRGTAGISVKLFPEGEHVWAGTSWSHVDVGVVEDGSRGWPARLEAVELGPRETAHLLANRFGELERVLPTEGALGGRLVRRCTGRPIEQTVTVTLVDADDRELALTRTRGGFFLLEDVAPGRPPHRLVVDWTSRGVLPRTGFWPDDRAGRETVELGELPPWRGPLAIEIDTGWRLAVEVVDSQGQPLRATVRAGRANISLHEDPPVHEWWDRPWDAEPMVVQVSVDDVIVHTETVEPPERSEPTRRLRVVVDG